MKFLSLGGQPAGLPPYVGAFPRTTGPTTALPSPHDLLRTLQQGPIRRIPRQAARGRPSRPRDRRRAHHPEPGQGQEPRARRNRSFFALLPAFWGLVGRGQRVLAFSLTTRTITSLLNLIPPALMGLLVNKVLVGAAQPGWAPAFLPTDPKRLLWVVAAALVAIAVTESVVNLSGRWMLTRITRVLAADIKRRAFTHAVRLPLHRIHQLKSGGLTALLREDAGTVADLTFGLFYNPWGAIVQLLGTLFVLAAIDWRMLVGGIALMPIVFYTHRTWIGRIRPVRRDIKAVMMQADSHATETFGGMRVVRAFGREAAESARYARRNNLVARQEIFAWWMSRGIDVAWQVFIPLASAGVVLYAGSEVLAGRLSPGDVAMFVLYLTMLLGPLSTLAGTSAAVQTQLAALDRVLDLLAEPVEFENVPEGVRLARDQVRGRVTLDNVTFAYPKLRKKGEQDAAEQAGEASFGSPVLHEVSLDVQPGETIALVGPSGSGKTTFCNLVARFYDPQHGRVLLDGRDVRGIDVQGFRSLLGVVEQDVFLFDGTVAENIGYARRGATTGQIVAAAKAANAEEFIADLDRGYETMIGERGVRLSGGQKQRIAIARALLADPAILILDEATSSLDTESEAYIQESLRHLTRGRTTFVIAHRLSTVRDADRIVVLDHGRIVEIGPHEQLLAAGGRYAAFLARQLEPQTIPGGPADR
ncbi:MAG: ABC transporter ATP-binding protein [Phycisphaerales bacterium]|nr:ABC transporter ATP-binding protein [Phycisphaerales bacterium]